MRRVMPALTGTMTSVSRPRRQFMASIAAATPTSVSKLPINRVTVCPRVFERVSVSLVRLLNTSPCGRLSKNRSDNRCKWPNSSARKSRTSRWAMRIITTACHQTPPVDSR